MKSLLIGLAGFAFCCTSLLAADTDTAEAEPAALPSEAVIAVKSGRPFTEAQLRQQQLSAANYATIEEREKAVFEAATLDFDGKTVRVYDLTNWNITERKAP